MLPKVYYVNLDRRLDRRKHFEAQVPWATRVRARDGLEAETRSLFDPLASLKPGEYGCAASHVDVWRRIASSKDPGAFVFEDDANISKGFHKTFERLELPNDAEVIFVSYSDHAGGADIIPLILSEQKASLNLRIFFEQKITCDVGIFKSEMDPCTTGYWITRQGAINLLAYLDGHKIDMAIDHYMNAYLKAKQIFYGLLMALATPKEGLGSDIQIDDDTPPKKNKTYVFQSHDGDAIFIEIPKVKKD